MNNLPRSWISQYKLYWLILFCTAILACSTLPVSSGKIKPEQARSTDSFLDSVGVVVHLNYSDTAYKKYSDIIKPRLQELGIHHIRSSVSLKDKNTQQKLNDLATIGIKSTLVMNSHKIANPMESLEIAKAVASSIEAVEGPNEWDLQPNLMYKGNSFPQGLRNFQAELFSAVKRDSKTAHLDVLAPSMGRAKNAFKLGNVACDVGTMHSYPGGRMPSTGLDDKWISSTKIICGTKPVIATETGYHNAIHKKTEIRTQPGVSEKASSKYLPRLFLEYFNRGIKRAYSYELIDLKPDPRLDRPKFHYGLLRSDGSPKPAFITLKNLIALLKNPNSPHSESFPLKSLDFELSGKTANVHHTLLQNRNGKFYLILWQEVSSFDLQTKADIFVPEQPVKLILNTPIRQAATYHPTQSITPLKRYSSPKHLKLNVPDHPLVVELVAANSSLTTQNIDS